MELPNDAEGHASSATVVLAVDFVLDLAGREVTVAEMAAAAHVTPRALQLAFRRHLQTTPTAYARSVRLGLAHRDLLDAVPGDGHSVTSVGARWGFTSSALARHHREAYGTLPSEVLRASP